MNHDFEFVKEVFNIVGLDWKKFVETNNPKFLRPAEVPSLKEIAQKLKEFLNGNRSINLKIYAEFCWRMI